MSMFFVANAALSDAWSRVCFKTSHWQCCVMRWHRANFVAGAVFWTLACLHLTISTLARPRDGRCCAARSRDFAWQAQNLVTLHGRWRELLSDSCRLHFPHFYMRTFRPRNCTCHIPLHTLHSKLHTSHATLKTPHLQLHTLPCANCTTHSSLHTWDF